jgi:hypothetical protein
VQSFVFVESEEKAVNKVEEKEKQIEPPPISNWSNDKEVSTEAYSFVTIPLETYHSPQVLSFQCLKEPSYVAILRIHAHKITNLDIVVLREILEASV